MELAKLSVGYIRSLYYSVCFFERFDSSFPTSNLSVTLNCLLLFGYHSRRQLQQDSRWGPEPRRPRMALTGEEPLDIVTCTENRHIWMGPHGCRAPLLWLRGAPISAGPERVLRRNNTRWQLGGALPDWCACETSRARYCAVLDSLCAASQL